MHKLRLTCLSLMLILFAVSCNNTTNTQVVSTVTVPLPPTPVPPLTVTPTLPGTLPRVEDSAPPNRSCLRSFHEFAYTTWDLLNGKVGNAQMLLPPPPWQIEVAIPVQQIEGYYSPHTIEAVLVRSTNEGQEIWIAQGVSSKSLSQNDTIVYTIYRPTSHSWESVSADIDGTKYYASDLFLTADGSVWGSIAGEYHQGDPVPVESVPVLSKFDEHTQRFEFAPNVLEIVPTVPDDPKLGWFPYFARIDIVLDKKRNIFWIFAENDGIYRYDPTTMVTQKWLDLPDLKVSSRLALSPNGSIFVKDFRLERMTEPYFHLYEGSLYQFFPDTREFMQLEMPDEPWPAFSGWLVDRSGKLWLGTVGYRESDGSWRLLHPDPAEYFEHAGDQAWSPPYLMLESSDGLLWYQKFLDMGPRYEGTAWYNPKTGEGCMFTNLAVNIIEDSERQLWLAADGKLYKYALSQPITRP